MVGQDREDWIASIVETSQALDNAHAFGDFDQSLRAPFVGGLDRAPQARGIEMWVAI